MFNPSLKTNFHTYTVDKENVMRPHLFFCQGNLDFESIQGKLWTMIRPNIMNPSFRNMTRNMGV